MSKISTIEDAILVRLQTLFPDSYRLTNPYIAEENSDRLLRVAYGFRMGAGSTPRGLLSAQLPILREFTVILTRKAYAKETDTDQKLTAEKNLLEDQYLVIKDFEQNTTLNETAIVTQYVSDTGISFISGEREQFLVLKTTFTVEYFEDLT